METRSLPVSFWLLLLCALVATNVIIYRTVFAPRALTVSVLEVGKAGEERATLMKTSGGKTLLIDTGPDASILRALGESLPMWQRSIDTVILTGDKTAQTGGLVSIESRYRVGEVLRAGTANFPYGTTISVDNTPITITAPSKYELK
jgi:hypothetical protein